MKNLCLSLVAVGLAAAFSGSALAGEASLNGWGKAYAEAAARQKAGVSANVSAEIGVKAVTPESSGARAGAERVKAGAEAAGERARGAAEGAVDKARTGVTNTRERVSSELADAARRLGESQPQASARVEVVAQATATARASERPVAVSLFQNPGALMERPALIERPAVFERPVINRPERLVNILR